MNHLSKYLNGKQINESVEINESFNDFVQSFKEMPSINYSEIDNNARINAHDLFSFYTANIIKEEIVFIR